MDLTALYGCKTCDRATPHSQERGSTPLNLKVTCGECGTTEELPPLYVPLQVTPTFLENTTRDGADR